MQDDAARLPDDDEPVAMTMAERSVWAYLVAVVLTSGAYLTHVGVRLADVPAAEVAWVVPMLWTIAASVLGSVVLTVVLTVGGTVTATVSRAVASARAGGHGRPVVRPDDVATAPDARDRDIDARGTRSLVGVLGAGFVGALALAMVDADAFWIGNLLFVAGTIGALVETGTKIRLYRRGF